MKFDMHKKKVIGTAAVFVAGVFSTLISYYAVGGTASAFICIMYVLTLFLCGASLLTKSFRRFATVLTVLVLAFTIPFQVANSLKLYQYTNEAERLVASLVDLERRHLPLPATIEELPLENRSFLPQIQSYKHEGKEIEFCYFVASPSTSYCYFSDRGWIYQDD